MSKTKYPNVGETYNAFDEGDINKCWLMKIKIVSITTIDKIKAKYARHIKELLIEEREIGDFYIKDSDEVVIGTLTENYNVHEPGAMFYFLRSPKYGWYGTNISDQTHPVLDIDGYNDGNIIYYSTLQRNKTIVSKKMSNWLKTGSFNKKDEYYTPRILVEVILPYLKSNSIVWCPFDTPNSEFVILLREQGHTVYYSHVIYGGDFFELQPPTNCDYIISNPPFTQKLDVFKRLYELDIPFAMVMGLPILNYQEVGDFFLDKDLQLLIVNKKVSFDGNTASFNNSYFCHKILPKDIIFADIKNNNSKKYYVESRMKQEMEDKFNVDDN